MSEESIFKLTIVEGKDDRGDATLILTKGGMQIYLDGDDVVQVWKYIIARVAEAGLFASVFGVPPRKKK